MANRSRRTQKSPVVQAASHYEIFDESLKEIEEIISRAGESKSGNKILSVVILKMKYMLTDLQDWAKKIYMQNVKKSSIVILGIYEKVE